MDWTRRRLVAGGTSLSLAAVAGCLGEGGAGASDGNGNEDEEIDDGNETPEENGSDENETDAHEPDAEAALEEADLEDYTGQEGLTVAVDPDEGFDPETFEVSRDTVITWVWEGSSTGPYPIDIPEECFWDEEVDEETVDEQESGDEYDRLFWAPGAYLYASRDDGEAFTGAFRVVESDGSDENNESDE